MAVRGNGGHYIILVQYSTSVHTIHTTTVVSLVSLCSLQLLFSAIASKIFSNWK